MGYHDTDPEQWQGFCSSSFWKDPVRTAGQLGLYLDADFLLQDPSAAEKILRSLTEKEIQSVIALPKILRLRDGQYLEKITEIAAGKSGIYKWLSGSKHGTYRVIKTMEFYRKRNLWGS